MKRAQLAPPDAVALPDPPVPPWPGRSVRLNGSMTYVRETPPTEPGLPRALYVHGLGGSAQNWTDLAGLLAGRVDGQAIDLPGFGRSDPSRQYTIGSLADRVIDWVEQDGRAPIHLVGNSLGGAISVSVAARRPDLVRTLTLISPAMPFLDPRRSEQGRLLPLLVFPHAERLAAKRLATIEPAELVRLVIEACFADPSRVSPQRLAEAEQEARLRYEVPWYIDAYLKTMRGLVGSFLRAYLPGQGSLWRVAGRIQAPTLVIAGRQDRLVDIRVAPRVGRTITDSRLLILDRVGHVAQMEVPEIVARAIMALLDEVAPLDATAAQPATQSNRVAADDEGVAPATAGRTQPQPDVAM